MDSTSLLKKREKLRLQQAVENALSNYSPSANEQKLLDRISELETQLSRFNSQSQSFQKQIYPTVSYYNELQQEIQSFVDLFISKYIVKQPSYRVEVGVINYLFRELAKDEDVNISERKIKGLLESRGLLQKPSNSTNYYVGINLIETPETLEAISLANSVVVPVPQSQLTPTQSNPPPATDSQKSSPAPARSNTTPTSFTQAGYPKSSPAPLTPRSSILPKLDGSDR